MRKLLSLIAILCLAVSVFGASALAAEPYELLPVGVVAYPERLEIHKIYEMATSVDPESIPRSDFERAGTLYTCADILREVVIGEETRSVIETESVESAKNDLETVLGLLPQTKEVLTEDGFLGILHLNTSSIKSEVSGYGSKTSSVSITRSYPNLSDEDTQYIPKSVTDNGKEYTLQDIQWLTDNTHNVDDYEIGNRYTAIATYSGSKTSSYVKGYIVTADYVGEVCRTGVSLIRYTVIFSGTTIPEPEPTPEPTPTSAPNSEPTPEPVKSGFNWPAVVIPLALLALASTGGFIYIFLKNRKERNSNAEITDYDYSDAYIDDGGGDPGDGGGD